MIEKILLDYLTDNMTADVYPEEPEQKPERYCLIEKTGSSEEDHIYSATIVIQSYAPSLLLAAELNQELKAVMKNAISLNEICKVTINSDYNYTDTNTKRHRYQAVFDVTHY